MPNWNSNTLTLVSKDEQINEVLKDYLSKDENGNDALDFEKIIPIPDGYKDDERWYDWCIENWGTKWNADTHGISDSEISFSTAWSPPLPIVSELATLVGKDLRLIYIEQGMGFCGEFFANADGSIEDNYYDIKDAPDELLNELGYEELEEIEN